MASETAISKARNICRYYGVKYRFVNNIPGAKGLAYPSGNKIKVDKTLKNNKFMSVVFHEIQHILNFRKGKYLEFHNTTDRKIIRKWALRAENYTDDQAEKLAVKHGFNNFIRAYEFNDYWRTVLNEYYKD